MQVSSAIHDLLADPDSAGSLADRTRRRRRSRLLTEFPEIENMSVLDLGGSGEFWDHMQVRPEHLTILNVVDVHGTGDARVLRGDACHPPPATFDRTYDLVISNSVIDQVGGLDRRKRFADIVMTAAPRYWVQTANRGFIIDAYFLFPWFSRLPVAARTRIVQHWPITHMHTEDAAEARRRVLSIELQSYSDMRSLFPTARILVEQFCWQAKSLIAVTG